MSVTLNISGTIIEFPSSAASPNWAPALIEFAQAVEGALSGLVGPFDVSPQTLNIDAYNPGTNVLIPKLSFPVSDVRAAEIIYSVYRNTNTNTAVETGNIQMVYNPDGPVNNKWSFAPERVGDASILFNITDAGVVRFSTTAISGSNHNGVLTYVAKALLQS